jgi:hypothetical protein
LSPPRRSRPGLARLADGLTLARLAAGAALVAALADERWMLAALLLAGAWVADALDGIAARASAAPTRLGRFDLAADTVVGAYALVGAGLAGRVPTAAAFAAVVVLGGGFLLLRNPALGLSLQAVGYAAVLLTLWGAGDPAVWLLAGTGALLLAAGHRRLLRTVIPGFLRGAAALPRLRSRTGWELTDRD